MNFTEDIEIDLHNLELEWAEQPKKAKIYGDNYSQLEKELDLKEEELELYNAQITDYINTNTDECLGKNVKATDANKQSYIIQQDEYQRLKSEIIELKHQVRIAKIAYEQMGNTRKASLENLVKLLQQNYFAGPTMPNNLPEKIEQKKLTRTDKLVAEKLKRKI